jgi:tRNA-dihydrouridine synthase 2
LEGGPGEGTEGKDEKNSPWPLELPQPGKEENEEQKKLLAESEKK